MVQVNLISSMLLSLGVALGVPVADAEEAEREILGAPERLEGPLDVLLVVAAAAEPVGAAAGTIAAIIEQEVNVCLGFNATQLRLQARALAFGIT